MAQATTDAEELAKAYADLWNERRYENIPDVVSESFVMYDPAAPEAGVAGQEGQARGRDGLEQFIRMVTEAFPDFRVQIREMLSSDDLVMYESELTMTHEGEFNGIAPTGETVTLRYMGNMTIADDEVQEHRVYFDQREIEAQLGLDSD